MPYMHKAKWGSLDVIGRKRLTVEPHLYSAKVGLICQGDGAEGAPVFWRTKTLRSRESDSMQLHDADDGAVLWRAELRPTERAAPFAQTGRSGGKLEYLTVVRLYMEYEPSPRLLLVHRDTQPYGLAKPASAKTISVFSYDAPSTALQPQATGATAATGTGSGVTVGAVGGDSNGDSSSSAAAAPSLAQIQACLDPAAPPAESAVFQLAVNEKRSAVTLSSVSAAEGADSVGVHREGAPPQRRVRTLALMARAPSSGRNCGVAVDSGLDLPLVMALFCAIEQLLLSDSSSDEEYGVKYAAAELPFSAMEYLTSSAQYERANTVFDEATAERSKPPPTDSAPGPAESSAERAVAKRRDSFWGVLSGMACFRS